MEGIMPHVRPQNAPSTSSASGSQRQGRKRRHRRGPKNRGQSNNNPSTPPGEQQHSKPQGRPSPNASLNKGSRRRPKKMPSRKASEEDLIDLFTDSNPVDRKTTPQPEPQVPVAEVTPAAEKPRRRRARRSGKGHKGGHPLSASEEKVPKQVNPANSKSPVRSAKRKPRARNAGPKRPPRREGAHFPAGNVIIDESTENDDEAWDFYRSINAQHQKARAQSTIFTLPLAHLHTHNTLLHSTMRSSLPSDPAILNGFAQCNNTAQRLLKRATNRDVNWAAQVQRMQDAYETKLAEEKSLSEGLLRQMQVEVERWMARCEDMERRAGSGRR